MEEHLFMGEGAVNFPVVGVCSLHLIVECLYISKDAHSWAQRPESDFEDSSVLKARKITRVQF